jgi:hypothetical protein
MRLARLIMRICGQLANFRRDQKTCAFLCGAKVDILTTRSAPRRLQVRCMRVAAVAALLGILAGCGVSRVTPGYVNPQSWTFVQGVMARGPMLARIDGQPFEVSPLVLQQTVIREMEAALAWYANPRFTANPQLAVAGGFSVSLVFNAGYLGAGQCAVQALADGKPLPGGEVEVSAAFCDGPELLSSVSGRLPQSTGANDPAFASLIRQVMQDLIPNPALFPRGSGMGIFLGF